MKIAIIKLSALGDIVHSSIVLQFIKKNIPSSEIHWICDERFSGILKDHEYIDRVISLKLKDKEFRDSYTRLKKLKKENYDIAIDLQGLIKSAIVGKIICSNLVGFDKNSIREKLAAKFYKDNFFIDYSENIILRNLKLVSRALNFNFNEDEIKNKKPCFAKLKREKPYNNISKILITIGSSWKSKIYPTNLQIQLINKLKNYEVYLCAGNKYEQEIAKEISAKTDAKILEKMDIQNLVTKMNEFDLVVGPDSGITHIAWAQNMPSLTIYGPTPSFRNSYITDVNLVIDSRKDINPLNLNKDSNYINLIKPDDIVVKIENIMDLVEKKELKEFVLNLDIESLNYISKIKFKNKIYWLKKARQTGPRKIQSFYSKIFNFDILILPEKKDKKNSLNYEYEKNLYFSKNGINVPRIRYKNDEFFIMEDSGKTLHELLKTCNEDEIKNLIDLSLEQLSKIHNIKEYHGGSQTRNFTYINDKMYVIDFEESFDAKTRLDVLQFRDFLLYLLSFTKIKNKKIDYRYIINRYIELTNNSFVEKKLLSYSKALKPFLKICNISFIKKRLGSDVKNFLNLFSDIEKLDDKNIF
ncbi:lipopolysaccharide heptosyltransferase I [Campylobacter blaseri]|uniref:Lipopolysaccharide heptosyltransferase 1 n=1 Tax=Campylobacter blaseri TaxID=2042961 RepID=A0A2P8QZQ1_9BACT|nr:lipopolysaccharide heptosyltransferase I [Campylobacter blaseri]PSM51725.1 lipopolysaccharide heptosyltransferase I [Campylobacter blaseri]PSM53516.1 lipopolysaccharide heptosyltransferase I [Campylobacter blaseri]QKF86324.1 lipopolysaccharide heptosyltransferase I [Campylobacter blaseri]